MHLEAKIKNLRYKKVIGTPLPELSFPSLDVFDVNLAPPAFILRSERAFFAISRWVSPKRTRSYPYARVYDCLFQPVSKTVAIVPIVKDEGKGSDTDYLQWDTVALLSLLNVYVIVAYYSFAKLKERKNKRGELIRALTQQRFDEGFVREKLRELSEYNASALHWNLNELEMKNLENVLNRAQSAYKEISEKYGIELPSLKGLHKMLNKLKEGAEAFKNFSRKKSKRAQGRETRTIQPKERLSNLPKARLTVRNYLGGLYHLTVDEIDTEGCKLIEAKHSSRSKLPKPGDVKDALLKMILYTNLEELKLEGKPCSRWEPVLKMTSSRLKGTYEGNEILSVIKGSRNRKFFEELIRESEANKFRVILEGV
ncbi:MAG: hypothetical protein GXO04_01590 [Aquificae bacterium]|nr:hypothetical protein [Aquificota bacterium]